MKNILIHSLAGLAYLWLTISSTSVNAQDRKISGTLVDSKTSEPIAGATITVHGSAEYTVTDMDGHFVINVADVSSKKKMKCACLGYKDKTVDIGAARELGTLQMVPEGYLLSDAIVTGQTVKLRKTPVVSSDVFASGIDERLGNQEFTEALKHTPGVHINRQGGGWGDSEIFMRGFDNSNIAVMINGIPVNDMETGTMYWSDWASLSDITALMQTQRGIGASRVSVPSVGGTINITTKGAEAGFGGSFSTKVGNDGFNKEAFSVSSGLMNGWALTLMGSRSSGDGYAQGTDFRVYSYFANVTKRFNHRHQLGLMVFGAPHRQHSRSNGLTKAEWEKVRSLYAVKKGDWTRYNPDYGFSSSGERKSGEYSEFHKTFISLSHVWEINDRSNWSTSLYGSLGRGGGYSGKADEDRYTEYDWYSADYGKLNTRFRRTDGTFDYSAIEEINSTSPDGSLLVMTQQDGKQYNLGLISTYTVRLLDCLDLSANIDLRRYRSGHTNRIVDLFGGQYYIDPCRSEVSVKNNPAVTPEWAAEHLGVGDVAYRDYDTHIMQEGANIQLEYSGKDITAFVSGSLSNTTYWKYDRLYYEKSQARSENVSFPGGTAKGGVNWNIGCRHNVFANAGFISRAPQFKSGAFMSPTSSNVTNRLARNEKSVTAEAGYGFHSPFVSVKGCAYFTEWMDKSMTKKGKLTQQYYINMTGVNSRHMGIEVEATATPAFWVEIYGMVSLGDWVWDSDNVKGYAYNLSGQAIDSEGNVTEPGSGSHAWAVINMKGVKVGGSAQTTAAIDVTFKPFQGLRIGGGYTLRDRNYAYYALSGSSLKIGKELYVNDAWRMPASGSLDARMSYWFKLGSVKATISGQVFNVLDSRPVEKAWNPSSVSSSRKQTTENNVYMFYSPGRTWCVGLKFDF